MSAVQVVQGFSKTNRWLLYASMMLAPAQAITGLRSNCPSNLGFLAYNWYTQLSWYWAIKSGNELHALSLLPAHFNTMFSISYLGGVTSGNIPMAILLGLGTGGVIILNNTASWTAWASNQPQGYGEYKFFFYGWRTLSPGWHKFFMVWQISDSIEAAFCVIVAITSAIYSATGFAEEYDEDSVPWWARYPAIPLGAIAMLIFIWPLILWVELIILKNNIESETDMIAVWLFVAQVGAMLVPSCSPVWRRVRGGD